MVNRKVLEIVLEKAKMNMTVEEYDALMEKTRQEAQEGSKGKLRGWKAYGRD